MPKTTSKAEEERKEHFERFAEIIDNLFTFSRRGGFMGAALDSVEGMSRWTPENVKKTLEKQLEEEAKKKRKRGRSADPNSGVLKVLLDVTAYGWILDHEQVSQHIVFNEMKQEVQWANKERTEFRDWAEEDDYDILIAIQRDGINVADKNIRLAVNRIAKINSFDPVLAWLKSLEWDGEERLHRLLPEFFNGEDTPYARAIGKMFMISAVARQFEPGCQVDHMLILEGRQGLYKTRGLEALFGKDYVNDNLMSIKGINASLGVKGFLAVNIDEMGTFKGNKLADLKSFITKREETYIRKYENRTTKEPRRCVFVGTTNEGQYLFDDDNRRYWPFEVTGKIDKDLIEQNRDQIWAEAVHLYEQGEQWWPTDELVPILKAEQLKRQPHTPLVDQLHQFVWFYRKITINEICEKLYSRQSSADKGKASIIGRQLSKLGFTSSRHHGSLQYWHRPDPIPDEFQLIIAQMLDHERSRYVEKMFEYSGKHRYPPDRSHCDPLLYEVYHAHKDFVRTQSDHYDRAKAFILKQAEQYSDSKENMRFINDFMDRAYFEIAHNAPLISVGHQYWMDWDGKITDGNNVEYDLQGYSIELDTTDLAALLDRDPTDPLLVEEASTLKRVHMAYEERQKAIDLDSRARMSAHREAYKEEYEAQRKRWRREVALKNAKLENRRRQEKGHEPLSVDAVEDKEDEIPDFFRDLRTSELGIEDHETNDQNTGLDENSFEYFKNLTND